MAATLASAPLAAQVLPGGGTVVQGSAAIQAPGPGQLRIDQSSARAVIDWQSFSIGSGGRVHFENGTGATLNRVVGGDPSSLMGQLSATGSLWLINPAGVLVGPEGRVTVGGSFVASTRDIAPHAFMAGDTRLEGQSAAGVVNAGTISSGADTVLVGALVENRGTVAAGGTAALVAAERLVLREAGADGRVHVEVASGGSGDVTTAGRIEAAAAELRAVGGNVYALAADTSGVVRATGSRTEGGRILLVGGAGVTVSGTLDASGPAGGDIAVTAPGIHLADGARLLAAGAAGDGGRIRVGGEQQGAPGLAAADRLLVSPGAVLDVSSASARGGTAILWSEEWTRFEGLIRADGPLGGGFVETSSKGALGIEAGEVQVGTGRWLLDPRDVVIGTGGFNPGAPYPNPFQIDPPSGAGPYTVSRSALQNALNLGSDVIVTTVQASASDPGNITVNATISWNGAGSLTLRADNAISVTQGITTSGSGNLTLDAAGGISTTATLSATGTGLLTLDAGTSISLGGAVSLQNGGSLRALAGTSISVNGAITSAANGTGSVLLDAGTSVDLNTNFTLNGSTGIRVIARGSGITFGGSGNRNFTTASGSLSLEAPGASGDIVLGRNQAAAGNWRIGTNGGALSVTAGRDILLVSSDFGNGRWTRVGNLGVNAPVTLSAGRNVTFDVGAFADDFVEVVTAGTLSITAGNAITLQPSAQSPARIQGRGSSFTLDAPTLTLNGTVEARGDTLLTADTVSFGSVAPLFTLDPNRNFTLDAPSTTAASALVIATSGTADVRLNGAISGTTLRATAGDELVFGGTIAMSGVDNALVLIAGRSLVNNAGASPLSAPNGRWLTYSVSPFDDIGWELLNPDVFNLYGRTSSFLPPLSAPGTGNRRIYSFAPVLTLVADSGTRSYGAPNPPLTATVTGLVPGDDPADAWLGSPTVTSPGFAPTAGVGSYVVTPGGITPTAQGYVLNPNPVLGTLLVTPAPLSIVADPQTREYGRNDPALTFSASGFVNGEDASVLTGGLARTAGENVGVYAILQNSLAAANYSISFTGADFTITPAPLAVTALPVSRLYGDADPAPLPFSASGFRLGDTAATALTGALSRTPGENVGSYTIGQGTLASTGNYSIAFTPGQLSITPAPLDVHADPQAKTYGQPDPALTFTATGFRLGDTVASLTGALSRTPGENVGVYDITQGTLANPNYQISFSDAAFTINPATLSITALPQTREYGRPDPILTFQATGFQFSDDASIITGGLVRAPGENVGVYAIGQNGLAAPNYVIAFTGADFTITPAPLLITPSNLQVDAANLPPDPPIPFVATGFRRGDTAATALTGALTRVGAGTSTPGDYAILPGTLASTGNYSLSFAPGTFSVVQSVLSIAALDVSRLYGEDDPILTFSASGFRPGDDISILTGSLVRAAGESVGAYAITQGTLTAPGYTIAFTPGTFTITPAPLTVAALDVTREYGIADPLPWGFSASGFRLGDTADTALTGALARVAGNNVGDYAILQGSLSAQNYTINFTPGTLRITPAPLAIVADDDSRTYGDADPAVLTFAASGFRLGDGPSILTGGLVRDPGEDVGSYAIRLGTLSAGPNYAVSFTPGTFRIDPATLSVTALDVARLYGDDDPALGFSASGFVLGDTAATALTGTLVRAGGENVGSYAITQGSLAARNYLIDFTPGTFRINPAPLSVTALSATREYGVADPLPWRFTATGFRLGDTAAVLSGALTRAPGEGVGLYAITQGSLAAANYAISFTPGTLSITPAPLAITADDVSRVYGAPDPALTFAASGFRLGDTAAILSGALVRDPGTDVGAYAIRQGTLSAGPNYQVRFTGGTFSITQALLQVRADSFVRRYGAQDPVLTFTTQGLVAGDTPATALTGALLRTPGEGVGTYAITQGSLSARNYSIAFTPGTLRIDPALLQVQALAQTREYGLADPALAFTATGFQFGETASVLTGALARDPGEAVGVYDITQGTLDGANYTIQFLGADFTITPAPLAVTAANLTKVYGAPDPALGFTATGFRLGDTAATVLAGALARAPGESVAGGPYAITQGSLVANANYALAFTPGSLAITPAALRIVAAPATKVYGDPDPALAFAASGFQFADTAATVLTGALGRTPGETVAGSPYAITQGTLAANSNYRIDFQGAPFTISRRLLAVTLVGEARRTYDATVTATLAATNFALAGVLPGDTVAATAATARYDTPDVGTGKQVTADGIQLTGASAGNYQVAATAAAPIGTITPAPLIARAEDARRPFGVANPPLQLSVSGLLGADTAAGIGLAASTAAIVTSPPGDYLIDVVGAPRNYTVTRIAGTLTVLPTPSFARLAPELVEIPALGGTTQAGVAVGVTALSDTFAAAPPEAPRIVFDGPRYTIAVEASAPPGVNPAGASAFDPTIR